MSKNHTRFARGTPVRVVLRDGRVLEDVFREYHSRFFELRDMGRVLHRDVRTINIRRHVYDHAGQKKALH
jgi:hypothetical protein